MDLTQKHCVPCKGGTLPLSEAEISSYLEKISEWQFIKESHHFIRREFVFKNFVGAMTFVNKVAGLAEQESHHPDIVIHYNRVALELWTHAVNGLSENDFILASKINQLA